MEGIARDFWHSATDCQMRGIDVTADYVGKKKKNKSNPTEKVMQHRIKA